MKNHRSLISIDFWDTLVIAQTGGKKRQKIRHDALCEVSFSYVENLPNDEIEEAIRQASVEFNQIWKSEHRTPSTKEIVNKILNNLGVPATKAELEYLVKKFEESLLEGPPELAGGLRDVLPELSSQYKTALISDTMFSPGRVIRTFLENNGLLSHFDSFIFSDEEGYSKPDPQAFQKVLTENNCTPEYSYHIGDLLETDIKGAKQVGMNTILFTGISGKKESDEIDIQADHTCSSWNEVSGLLL